MDLRRTTSKQRSAENEPPLLRKYVLAAGNRTKCSILQEDANTKRSILQRPKTIPTIILCERPGILRRCGLQNGRKCSESSILQLAGNIINCSILQTVGNIAKYSILQTVGDVGKRSSLQTATDITKCSILRTKEVF